MIHFRGWFIRPVSCYTLLSGFRLPDAQTALMTVSVTPSSVPSTFRGGKPQVLPRKLCVLSKSIAPTKSSPRTLSVPASLLISFVAVIQNTHCGPLVTLMATVRLSGCTNALWEYLMSLG